LKGTISVWDTAAANARISSFSIRLFFTTGKPSRYVPACFKTSPLALELAKILTSSGAWFHPKGWLTVFEKVITSARQAVENSRHVRKTTQIFVFFIFQFLYKATMIVNIQVLRPLKKAPFCPIPAPAPWNAKPIPLGSGSNFARSEALALSSNYSQCMSACPACPEKYGSHFTGVGPADRTGVVKM
jgi:hypothetical protein